MILNEVWRAVGYLFFAGIISYIYSLVINSEDDWKKLLKQGLLYCFIGSFILASFLGKPSCESRDGYDGPCESYADDGFEPTNEQYISEFAFYFTLSFVPVLYGINQRRKNT